MKSYYRIGNIRILYTGPQIEEADYLKVFREWSDSEDDNEKAGDHSSVNDSAKQSNGDSSYDIHMNVDDPDPDMNYNTRFFMINLNLPAKVLDYNAVFLHASYIIWHGKAILFTAPKQIGKSTQAGLWERYKGAEIINGDRALIRKSSTQTDTDAGILQQGDSAADRKECWMVYGSPYCGTSKICKNKNAKLATVVILGQAPENVIRPANIGQSVQAMLDGCSYDTSDKNQVEKVMNLIMSMVQEVPFIVMDCLPDQTAADALEEYLCRMKIV